MNRLSAESPIDPGARPTLACATLRRSIARRRWMSRALHAGMLAAAFFVAPARAEAPPASPAAVSATAASAPTDDVELARLLERVRAAVGAERLAARTNALRAVGRGSLGGVDGAWQFVLLPDGTALQRFDGLFTYGAARQGDRTWVIDLGGEVREAFEADREAQELGFLMLDHRWLAPDGPLRLTLVPPTRLQEDDGVIVVAFTPHHGRLSGVVELDAATALPRQWRFGTGEAETVVRLSDWRDHDGARLPGRLETSGTAGLSSSVVVERIEDAPALRTEQVVPPRPPTVDVRFDRALPNAIEVVRAPTGHLLVHPLVDGQDVGWFIFDSGAGMNVLATAAIAQLGLETFGEVPANGIGGRTPSHFCRPASLALGPATLERPLMVGLDLSFLDQHMGRKIGGLVGFGFLARVVVELDLAASSIALHDPATFDGSALSWQRLVLDQRLPHVDAAFALPPLPAPAGGATDAVAATPQAERVHRGLFRLDTGAAGSTVSMHEPAVRELELLEGLETTDGKVGGVGGFVPIKKGRLAWFELGGVRTAEPKAEFALEPRGAFADPHVLGNIGGALLLPFTLVFDYPHGRIAFVARSAAGAP